MKTVKQASLDAMIKAHAQLFDFDCEEERTEDRIYKWHTVTIDGKVLSPTSYDPSDFMKDDWQEGFRSGYNTARVEVARRNRVIIFFEDVAKGISILFGRITRLTFRPIFARERICRKQIVELENALCEWYAEAIIDEDKELEEVLLDIAERTDVISKLK